MTTLTPRGHAALAILCLKRQLEQPDAADLEYIGPILADLLVDAARAATA